MTRARLADTLCQVGAASFLIGIFSAPVPQVSIWATTALIVVGFLLPPLTTFISKE